MTRLISILSTSTAALALIVGSPAAAQLGGIVYDPTNYAQNVLTAARTLHQINNQIVQIQHQAQSLKNEARNLTRLPTNTLTSLQRDIDRTRTLIRQAQRIAFKVDAIDRVFEQRYRAGPLTDTSPRALIADARARWTDALAGYQDALRTGATVIGNIDRTRDQTSTLITASQGAVGALQASQAGNQLIALQTRQLADLTAIVAAQSRASAISAARAAADEAQGREQVRRFTQPSATYVAPIVSLFHD